MPVYSCPRGHQSSEADFCSECGARIQAPPSMESTAGASSQACPDCGAPRTGTSSNFCEVCGYNFVTGAHGTVSEPSPPPPPSPVVAPPPPVTPPVAAAPTPTPPEPDPPVARPEPELPAEPTAPEPPKSWTLTVAIDPSLAELNGPQPPANVDPVTIPLDKPISLIGRKSEKRAILPEVALDLDDGVSHRHALLTRGDDGSLTLRDIGSSNGTRLNGADVQPLSDVALHDGDQITLGRWSRLTVKTL